MSEKPKFRLEVDLRPNGKVESFVDLDDVLNWLKKEKEFWVWPQNLRERDSDAFHCVQLQLSKLDELSNLVDKARQLITNQGAFEQSINQLKSVFEKYYKKGHIIHSSHPRAKYVSDQRKENDIHAAFILKYYIQNDTGYAQHQKYLEGALHALLFDFNIKGGYKGELQSLTELRDDWQENLTKSSEEAENIVDALKRRLEMADEQLENQAGTHQNAIQKMEGQQAKHIKRLEQRFEEIEELYEKKLALHASMKYWGHKAGSHFRWAVGFTFAVLLGFGVVGRWFFHIMTAVIGDSTLNEIELWKIGQLLLVATIGIWLMRVLIRLLLSNIHLWNDANERRTMLQTYLALHNEGQLPDSSRELILQALFRPTSTGIVKDDAAPPFMAEWIKKATGNE